MKTTNKIITVLKDYEAESIDAVIISKITTPDEIDHIINLAKQKKSEEQESQGLDYECFNQDDLIKVLPSDCKIIWVNSGNIVLW